jgi:hypothetical protein
MACEAMVLRHFACGFADAGIGKSGPLKLLGELGSEGISDQQFFGRMFGAVQHLLEGFGVCLQLGAAFRRRGSSGESYSKLLEKSAAFGALDYRGHDEWGL